LHIFLFLSSDYCFVRAYYWHDFTGEKIKKAKWLAQSGAGGKWKRGFKLRSLDSKAFGCSIDLFLVL
jgi:hypothetical protein